MNSKFCYLIILILLIGCGVKAKPLNRPDTVIQSYIETYTGPTPDKTSVEKKK